MKNKYKYTIVPVEKIANSAYMPKEQFLERIKQINLSVGDISKPFELFNNSYVLLCYDEEKIVGYLHLIPEKAFSECAEPDNKNIYVDYVVVHKDYQHQGIANSLYKEAFKLTRLMNYKTISATLFNEHSAKAFYKNAKQLHLTAKENSVNGNVTVSLNEEKEK